MNLVLKLFDKFIAPKVFTHVGVFKYLWLIVVVVRADPWGLDRIRKAFVLIVAV